MNDVKKIIHFNIDIPEETLETSHSKSVEKTDKSFKTEIDALKNEVKRLQDTINDKDKVIDSKDEVIDALNYEKDLLEANLENKNTIIKSHQNDIESIQSSAGYIVGKSNAIKNNK